METQEEKSDSTPTAAFVSLKQSILVIDDNVDALNLQKVLLGLEGYDVFTAESGEEAIHVLGDIEDPDLILLDMRLGDMSGIEFLDILEKKRPDVVKHVPVVFLTGMDEVPESKAIGFIRKPADSDQFLKTVHHFIEIGRHAPYKCELR